MRPSGPRPATRTNERAARSVSLDETLELFDGNRLGEQRDVGKLEGFLHQWIRLGVSRQVDDPTHEVMLFEPPVDIDPRRRSSSEVDVEHGQASRERG